MTRRPFTLRAVAALLALTGVVACTDGTPTASPSPSVSPAPSVTPSASPSPTVSRSPSPTPSPRPTAPCPEGYAGGSDDQPQVTLSFRVPEDKRVVTGSEKVVFTPDLPIDRLVFRLWANGPTARRGGGGSRVTSASVDGKAATFATSQSGTLLSIPLAARVRPGTVLVVELDFTLTLPSGVNERWGRSGSTAWFGSGFPLLAWQFGRGWATEPPTSAFAEAATSETFTLVELTVDAPPGDVVLATGSPLGDRKNAWSSAGVRDVMVAVGRFRVARDHVLGDIVTVGVAPGLPDSPAALLEKHRSAITQLSDKFGAHPYGSLDVAVVPVVRGGIEFPGAIILGSGQDRDATLVHEVAHQWFYSLVGNNQGRHPWIDESFATYAEAIVRGTGSRYLTTSIPASGRNRVGAPMTYWESHQSAYYRSVYVQGAAALLRARARVGAERFDKAVRCYIHANGSGIATPEDVEAAFVELPAVITELRRVGALPPA